MSAETVLAPTPAPTAPKRAVAKKAAPKRPAAKQAPAKRAKAAAKPDRGMADEPAAVRRTKLVGLLRRLRATDSAAARPVSELAAKLGYTSYDVYCLGYEKYKLFREGYVRHARPEEGGRETCLYLTAKGLKQLPE